MAALSDLIEGGMSARDAAAKMMKDNLRCIFTGNGYSAEWPVEAVARGLPNLKNTYLAVSSLTSESTKALFSRMKVLTPADLEARQECMFENFVTCLEVEAATMVRMCDTGVIPACAADLAGYKDSLVAELVGERPAVYKSVVTEKIALQKLIDA